MENKALNHDCLKSFGEKGVHNKLDWMNEAEGKRTSALMLREIAKQKQSELSDHFENDEPTSSTIFKLYQPCESARKNSFLLLGYAIELLLKSGFVSLLISTPKWALEKCVKKYSHKLACLAKDLHIQLDEREFSLLNDLGSFIVNETRYPVTASGIQDYCNIINTLSAQFANDGAFDLALKIYDKVLGVIKTIDGTEDNPKTYNRVEVDSDGFITFRQGGSLPPVFVIKHSTKQIEANNDNLIAVKELLETYDSASHKQMLRCWQSADFYSVSEKNGLKKL
jgi:hypothetical protein